MKRILLSQHNDNTQERMGEFENACLQLRLTKTFQYFSQTFSFDCIRLVIFYTSKFLFRERHSYSCSWALQALLWNIGQKISKQSWRKEIRNSNSAPLADFFITLHLYPPCGWDLGSRKRPLHKSCHFFEVAAAPKFGLVSLDKTGFCCAGINFFWKNWQLRWSPRYALESTRADDCSRHLLQFVRACSLWII